MVSVKDKDIQRVIDLLKSNDLQELEVKDGQKVVRVVASFSGPLAVAETTPAPTPKAEVDSLPHVSSNTTTITSPIVGTAYLTPSPDEKPFVQEGQSVKKGQTVCLIEAMKTFNHIKSPSDSQIIEICVANGETVEFGQTLFILAPISD